MKLKGFPKKVTLKNGEQVVIRALNSKDNPKLMEFFRALPKEDRLFLRGDVTQQKWVDDYVNNIDHTARVPLVAVHQKNVVGNATLYRSRYGWTVHVAKLRVAVARQYQRQGLGTALAKALVKIAMSIGIEKMTVEVVDNQISAKCAFEKLGFYPEAILKGHVKDINGKRRNLVIMANDVSHIWDALEHMVTDFQPHR
jgi:ribosomal protein S18 acetylase RimI-like enzyme